MRFERTRRKDAGDENNRQMRRRVVEWRGSYGRVFA